uniref:C2H2-type domain-containing protein n=1 Tax=Romanomermis culicivorax TaxID=13658 RepID=A0A915JCR3_ROMCU
MPLGAPSSACGASIVPCQNDHHEKLAIENLATNLGKTMDGTHHRCIYCGKIYSRKYGLKIHLRTHTGFRPLKCKFCARPFGDPSNLNKHTRLHVESGDLNCAAVYPCHVCKKSWSRKRDLERHLVSRHSHPKNL